MKIQTFSIVVGTSACDASCSFCVSHTTGFHNLSDDKEINWHNFDKAVKLAQLGGTTTVLITGKGEPTLYPKEITQYLDRLNELGDPFPFIELQTNAIGIGQKGFSKEPVFQHTLMDWHLKGLSTIAISTVGINPEHNKETYLHHRNTEYPNIEDTVKYLREIGYSIRLCVMMENGKVDCFSRVRQVSDWCKRNEVAQLTIRPIRKPDAKQLPVLGQSKEYDYITTHGLTERQETRIRSELEVEGTHILSLMNGSHRAFIYDLFGQNVCMADCLTIEPQSDDIRTLIFYSSGRLCYDWQYDGARLL